MDILDYCYVNVNDNVNIWVGFKCNICIRFALGTMPTQEEQMYDAKFHELENAIMSALKGADMRVRSESMVPGASAPGIGE